MARENTPGEGPASVGSFEADDEFLGDYYGQVASEDLLSYDADVLKGRARRHAALAAVRPPGTCTVEVLHDGDASVVFVVADEMPHLLHSVAAELAREEASIRLLVHATFQVHRHPGTGELLELHRGPQRAGFPAVEGAARGGGSGPGGRTETWVAAEIGMIVDPSGAEELRANLQGVLADVRAVAEDSPALHARVAAAVAALSDLPDGCDPAPDQLRELLLWLDRGNFMLFGYSEDTLTTAGGSDVLRPRAGSGLGLLRSRTMPDEAVRPLSPTEQVLMVSTLAVRSAVERPSYLDEIRLTTFDGAGAPTGERRFVGLFAAGATGRSARKIPVVRNKVAAVQERLGVAPASQDGRELVGALDSLPPEELFQLDVDELARLAVDILRLHERRQTRLFLRADGHGPFVTALVFLPRHRYSTAVRLSLEKELRQAFNASSLEFDVRMSESPMARVFFRLLVPPGEAVDAVDPAALERSLIAAMRTWAEGLEEALRTRVPADEVGRLSALWSGAFPAGYRADVDPAAAVEDIVRFEQFDLDGTGGRPLDDPLLVVEPPTSARPGPAAAARGVRIRLYLTAPRSLTQILPAFHHLGLEVLDQRPFELVRGKDRALFLYDVGVTYPAGADPAGTSALLADAFMVAMRGDAESDRFDALVLREGVPWRQVAILRAYAKYLLQLGTTNSYDFIADVLLANSAATHALLGLFRARFSPGLGITERLRETAAARSAVTAAIDAVPSLDADRLLRIFLSLIESTTRTNFYRDRTYLSFKLQPAHIPGAPYPRPKVEVWVYSPRVEGVHLRFGPVARGGIRWSDRPEDFRTEVLGLVKAQTVKNAVIVPTGAKGGFFPKLLPDPEVDRAGWLAEGVEGYKEFLRGLLDVTDNLAAPDAAASPDVRDLQGSVGRIVPPPNVVRHDDHDYYLVVAADKGTAAFSDLANEVAQEYGYWLGDAFASGGSTGYDHKRMGITARGAWESVRHHFSELGVDCQRQDFTAVGIGDMSGDVFGNGMLLSRHLRLVAAFDHRHIFLDPTPDAPVSFEERRRLFELPRSSWADYNPQLISPGGGVYSRSAKSIALTAPVRAALGLTPSVTAITPPELIQAILRAPVDLLYNGGIGTYVKASTETSAEVGDKANDPVRVNGSELRARIVVEGGNLGLTQRGRIEAALNGVLVNTDAIDNSAGVDCSDHEVNIKIFVDRMIAAGRMPAGERADFLRSLTDDVARLVLKDNRDQNSLLLNDRQLVVSWSGSFERTMDWLEKATDLDRALEALPTTQELHDRLATGQGVAVPELSVLAAYAKIALAKELGESDVAEDPWFDRVLRGYFPPQIADRFGSELGTHPLRQQIISTVLANDIINLGGITFAFRAIEETAGNAAALARAFVAVREALGLQWIADRIAELPADLPAEHGAELAVYVRRMLDRGTRWYMTHDHRDQPVTRALSRLKPAMELRQNRALVYVRGEDRNLEQDLLGRWASIGIPPDLARRALDTVLGFNLFDVSFIAEQTHEPLERVAELYSAVFAHIGAYKLLLKITDLPRRTRWEALVRATLRDDAYSVIADMAISVLQTTRSDDLHHADPLDRIVEWERGRQELLARIKDMFAEATAPGPADLASLSVVVKLLRTLVRT